MKKLIALCLAMVMCLSVFASCELFKEPEDTTGKEDTTTNTEAKTEQKTEAKTEATTEATETETAGPEYDVAAAAEYVDSLYKKSETVTAADYEVVGQVMIAGIKYTITWTTDSELVKTVQGESTWTIDVDEKATADLTYKLTGTITAPDGTTATVTYEHTVPKYVLVSFEDYMAAEEGTTVVIEGIVVAMNGKSANNKYNHLFLADASGKGGYYCYSLEDDPVAAGVKVGMTVSVTAVVTPYSGMQETKGGTFTIVDETIKTVAPVDITEKFAAGKDLKNYVGLPVVIKGVEIGTQDMSKDTSQYLYFNIGEESGYVRTYVSDFPTTLKVNLEAGVYSSPDKTTIDADHAAHFGYKADATGILILYSGAPYLIPMSTTPFTNYVEVIKTPAEKIADEKKALTVADRITENTTITLPAVGEYYNDVTITWAINSDVFAIDDKGQIAIALGENDVEFTLTATIKCGETTETKEFKVLVESVSSDVYVPEIVETPVAGSEYVMVLDQKTLGKAFYFAGYMDGYYLATTDKADKAVTVYVEAVADTEGAYSLYFMDGETKTYIEVYEREAGAAGKGKGSVKLVTEAPATYYTYDATAKTFVFTAADGVNSYYLGTYSKYNTLSVSNAAYITGDNASKVDDSQFPARMATLAPATYVPEIVETPAAGSEYVMVLDQKTLGKAFYFAGYMDGYYLATTDKADKAVTVYVEAVADTEGAYRLYFMDGETKTYIEVYEREAGAAGKGKGSVKLVTEAPATYYTYDATAKTFVFTAADGVNSYYLGTYSKYNTLSVSNAAYITGDNASKVDDSQFPARMATVKAVKVAPVIPETLATDTAYKFNLNQVTLGKQFYFAGYMDGFYLATTDKLSKAVDVFVEAVADTEGAYRLYFMDGETKTYIEVYEREAGAAGKGKGSVKLVTEAPATYYTYDATAKTFVFTAADGVNSYYLGTYSKYNTFSVSNAAYITGDNASKVDDSQFPARVVTIEIAK